MSLTSPFRPHATKVCRTCKIEKLIKEFKASINYKDGRTLDCRACTKDKEEARKLERKKYSKTFFDEKEF